MKEIKLTQGKIALVDDDMYEELNQFKWYAHKNRNTFYAGRNSKPINGKRFQIHMHHEIIGKPPKGYIADHKNGDGLRNLRNNLRHVTNRQNGQNKKNIKKSSKYPGVCWFKRDKKWQVHITTNGVAKFLGHFANEEKAFEAYKKAVNELGEKVIDGIA